MTILEARPEARIVVADPERSDDPLEPFVPLRRSDPLGAGYSRVHGPHGFVYRSSFGDVVDDPRLLERFASLALPPAWREVWIAPYEDGHIQAIGVDAAGRKQYRYHPEWRQRKDRAKFVRAMVLSERLPAARRTVALHLRDEHMTKRKALAAAFRVLDHGGLRIGSERYEEENGSRGLTTLLRQDATPLARAVRFRFPAKSHKTWDSVVKDPLLARVVADLQQRDGDDPHLFAFESHGIWHRITPQEVNAYIKDRLGEHFSAKDFRTLRGTVEAAKSLAKHGPETSPAKQKRAVAQAMRDAAAALSNTPAIARASYVDPRLVEQYCAGRTIDPARLRQAEAEVRSLLFASPEAAISQQGDWDAAAAAL